VNKTGLRFFEEVKKIPERSMLEFIKNLQNKTLVGPLKVYSSSYINKTITWATSVILTLN